MRREFVYTRAFHKKWLALGLSENELASLEASLLDNPEAGAIMQGTGGLRKMRWALPEHGKSGGIRVLYIDFVYYEKLYLIDLFTKNEKDNLTAAERNAIYRVIKSLEEELIK